MGHPCSKISSEELIKASLSRDAARQVPRRKNPGRFVKAVSGQHNFTYAEASAAFIDIHAVKTQDDKAAIISALSNHFIFTALSDEDRECVADAMQLHVFEGGKVVFEQGRPSKSYYVLKTCSVAKVEELGFHENLISQKLILNSIDHPMIMKLVKTIKENNNIMHVQRNLDTKFVNHTCSLQDMCAFSV